MALIKGTQAGDLIQEAIVLDLGDLRRQADRMKAEARAEAERIVAEGRRRAEELTAGAAERGHAEGYQRGHAEGVEAGRQAGAEKAAQQVAAQGAQLQQAWAEALGRWEAEREQMLLEARQLLLELSVAMAARIVHRVPRVDPTVVADQVEAALQYVTKPGAVTIRIHPEDRSLVERALPALMQSLGGAEHARLVDDPAMTRGGCVLSNGQGRIDATLDRQLQRLVESLLPGADTAEPSAEIAPSAADVDTSTEEDPENS